jgi:hypothetical protein
MASETRSEKKLSEHPLLVKLLAQGAADTVALYGYVGPSRDGGSVSLYRSLDNPSEHIDIRREDILHIEDVPETVALFGAKIVWVRKDAKITHCQVETAEAVAAVSLARTNDVARQNDFVEVRQGRLRMQVPLQGDVVARDCHTPCSACATGRCSECRSVDTCQSICRYTPPK